MTSGSMVAGTLVVTCLSVPVGWPLAAQPAVAPQQSLTLRLDGATTMEFVKIAPGTFQMGSEYNRPEQGPVHWVTISQDFELGKYEVTQAQWVAVMGSNPSEFARPFWGDLCGPTCPVESVSWEETQAFMAKLNARMDGYRYRLPTEAEWEYAARAGTTGGFGGTGKPDEMGWYFPSAGGHTHPVGQKQPNEWGLYDMHGNVQEWVEDWWGLYAAGAVSDPRGPAGGDSRVTRGGCWDLSATSASSFARNGHPPDRRGPWGGFRLLRVPSNPKK